jgi:hypothetical protein
MLLAAICSSLRVTLTPTLMFGANMMAVFSAAARIAALPASSKPVVPMIILMPWAAQYSRCLRVPSGRVKSIRNSQSARPLASSDWIATPASWPENAPASVPMLGEPGTSSAPANVASGAAAMASTSIRPMRPLAPATAIFMSNLLYLLIWMDAEPASSFLGVVAVLTLAGPAMRAI